MNRHFNDAWYYAKRAATNLAIGLRIELRPVEERLRELTGREVEPEPSRIDELRGEVREFERTAEQTARETAKTARSKIRGYQ